MIKGQYEKIIEKRPMIETFVLGTMLKHPGLFQEYKISEVDFIYDKTKFFFSLGKAMAKRHNSLDQASVLEFVNSNKDFKELYEEHGGWKSISSAMEYANEKNIDVYIDNLAKNNLLISFDKKNFDMISLVEHNGVEFSPFRDLFQDMNCREVAEFYEGIISSCETTSKNSNLKFESLILRKDEIEKLKNKEEAGTPYNIIFEYTEKEIGMSDSEEIKYIYGLPLTSYITNGLGNGGGITTFAGFSGIGKTTINFLYYVLPMVYRQEKAVMFSNEQGVKYFRALLTSFVAANVFKYYKLSRTKIMNGTFSKEEEVLMHKIEQFLDNRGYDELLEFCSLEEFDVEEIIRISKGKVAHEGCSVILIDTFKSENASDAQSHGHMVENAKALDEFGNKYNIKVLLTMQLMPSQEMKNAYLTASDLSESKGVKTVCDLLFLMRKVVPDIELDDKNKKFFLKPYRLKNDTLRKDEKVREYIKFTEEDFKKDYRLTFLNKSRRGDDDIVMLLRFNGINGSFEEVGICEHIHRGALSY